MCGSTYSGATKVAPMLLAPTRGEDQPEASRFSCATRRRRPSVAVPGEPGGLALSPSGTSKRTACGKKTSPALFRSCFCRLVHASPMLPRGAWERGVCGRERWKLVSRAVGRGS